MRKLERTDLDQDLEELKNLYHASFPDAERKPFEMIEKGIREGFMEGYVLEEKGNLLGLAFLIRDEKAWILDYLAVNPAVQSRGLGSKMIRLLGELVQEPLIVEIESSLDGDPLALRRKSFYLRNGFIDDEEPIMLFDVPMELLSTKEKITFDDYFGIFSRYIARHDGFDTVSLKEKVRKQNGKKS